MTPKKLKPDAAPIKAYHATLQTYADHDAVHEGANRQRPALGDRSI